MLSASAKLNRKTQSKSTHNYDRRRNKALHYSLNHVVTRECVDSVRAVLGYSSLSGRTQLPGSMLETHDVTIVAVHLSHYPVGVIHRYNTDVLRDNNAVILTSQV